MRLNLQISLARPMHSYISGGMMRNKMPKRRYVVFEQDANTTARAVGDIWGVFYNYSRAELLARRMKMEHPDKLYLIKEILTGWRWL